MEQAERKMVLNQVYDALTEKGYRPEDQIIGYILTGDPAYITNHNGARRTITTVDRHELLKDIVLGYFATETQSA